MNDTKNFNSNYLIPEEFIPILVNKTLFKNPKKAVKSIGDIKIPIYILNDFGQSCIKKSPNAFILFRKEMFQKVKLDNPNNSSREISIIIGKMWKAMTKENKLPYLKHANSIKNSQQNYKYNKFLRNIKQRDYIKTKELYNNPFISSLNELLLSEL
jgi:hypothetical protein